MLITGFRNSASCAARFYRRGRLRRRRVCWPSAGICLAAIVALLSCATSAVAQPMLSQPDELPISQVEAQGGGQSIPLQTGQEAGSISCRKDGGVESSSGARPPILPSDDQDDTGDLLDLPPTIGLGPRTGAYDSLRYNDRYEKGDQRLLAGLKSIPLGFYDGARLTISGQERFRSELVTGKANGWLAQIGHQLNVELSFDSNVRFFGQFASGQQVESRSLRPVSPRHENDLAVSQAFVELQTGGGEENIGLRLGRQQVHFGSGQIFSLQPTLNLMRNYDGARAYYYSPALRVDGFALHPVDYAAGVFDDKTDTAIKIVGLYVTAPFVSTEEVSLNIDPFLVSYSNNEARFGGAVGRERRGIYGVRLWGNANRLGLDYTLIYQKGRFGTRGIDALAARTSTSVPLNNKEDPIEATLQVDFASGGSLYAGKIRTFEPLYSNNGYISAGALIWPANFYDIGPGIRIPIEEDSLLEIINRWYWRYSVLDTVYGTNAVSQIPSLLSKARYIGVQPSIEYQVRASDNLDLKISSAYFFAGDSMRQAGLKSAGFFRFEMTFIY